MRRAPRIAIAVTFGVVITVALAALAFMMLFGMVWSSIHGGGPSGSALQVISVAFMILPPAAGVLCGWALYRRIPDGTAPRQPKDSGRAV
jgi:hypothetical protein